MTEETLKKEIRRDYKIKDIYSRFSTKKDALKCFRLLSALGEICFLNKGYGLGVSDKKKNIIWIRELKPIELNKEKR